MPTPKPKAVGRPRVHKDHAKSQIVPVRLSADDRERIKAAAADKHQTVSKWIREAIEAAL